MANESFYDSAEYETPMVDLALVLSTENSAYGVKREFANMGL